MNSAVSTLETVLWRKYVRDPNPHLVELIRYLITYLKDKRYAMSSTLTLTLSKVRYNVPNPELYPTLPYPNPNAPTNKYVYVPKKTMKKDPNNVPNSNGRTALFTSPKFPCAEQTTTKSREIFC